MFRAIKRPVIENFLPLIYSVIESGFNIKVFVAKSIKPMKTM